MEYLLAMLPGLGIVGVWLLLWGVIEILFRLEMKREGRRLKVSPREGQ